jgi:hypothetical protein
MTSNSGTTPEPHGDEPAAAGDDQKSYPFDYGHGRMPLFMKIAWIAFLAFATWYVVQFLLTSVGEEMGT